MGTKILSHGKETRSCEDFDFSPAHGIVIHTHFHSHTYMPNTLTAYAFSSFLLLITVI